MKVEVSPHPVAVARYLIHLGVPSENSEFSLGITGGTVPSENYSKARLRRYRLRYACESTYVAAVGENT